MAAAETLAPRPSPPPNLGNPRFELLDSLRGIAALSVFVAHLTLYFARVADGQTLEPILARADIGVALFLLLSSFLLYRPYAQARLTGSRPPAVVPFAVRRALRVVPTYWVSLPLIALLLGLSDVFTPEGIVTYFGFLQIYQGDTIDGGIGQAWTICVEITFYAMLPLWAWLARRVSFTSLRGFVLTELAALGTIAVMSLLWKIKFAEVVPVAGQADLDPVMWTLPPYLDSFAVGMALAVLSVAAASRERQPRAVRLIDRAPWVPWVGAAVLLWLSGVGGGRFAFDSQAAFIFHQEMNTLVAVGVFLPAIFGDQTRGWVRRLLAHRALAWLGLVSYGLYLWHLAVMQKLADAGLLEGTFGPLAFAVAALALSIAAGAAAYYGVGRYALRLGRRLPRDGGFRRRTEHPPAPVGTARPGEAGAQ